MTLKRSINRTNACSRNIGILAYNNIWDVKARLPLLQILMLIFPLYTFLRSFNLTWIYASKFRWLSSGALRCLLARLTFARVLTLTCLTRDLDIWVSFWRFWLKIVPYFRLLRIYWLTLLSLAARITLWKYNIHGLWLILIVILLLLLLWKSMIHIVVFHS